MSNTERRRLRGTVAAVAAGALAVTGGVLGAMGAATASTTPAATAGHGPTVYRFATLNNQTDPTFNQLLGINNKGLIAGYFGSGVADHPNKGYLLASPYGQSNYVSENFPGSVQTQVTGLNDKGVSVGFWSSMNNANLVNDNHGFWMSKGRFHHADFPAGGGASPVVDQLLGVNNGGLAVGFWTDAAGNNHGYTYNVHTHRFTVVSDPAAPGASLTAAAINGHGDIAGFYVNAAAGNTDGFVLSKRGHFTDLAMPGASMTQAFGVNDHGEVVGDYTVGTGGGAATHGFTWTPGGGFVTVDDPHGLGATTINGVNDAGDLVGFYTDAAGNTDGLLATALRPVTVHLRLAAMPAGTATVKRAGHGQWTITISAFGLTPGSTHTVKFHGAPVGSVTANGTGQVAASLTVNRVPGGGRVKILDGGTGTPVIAQTIPLEPGKGTHPLHAIENGFPQGSLAGHATLVYDPAAQTISVTLTASGVSPGAHAAHIHVGSCASQGPVQYMLMDFTANAHGNINHETRTVTNVTTPLPASGWYLNLHQGNSGNILSNGNPTIKFRPLLCANIATQG